MAKCGRLVNDFPYASKIPFWFYVGPFKPFQPKIDFHHKAPRPKSTFVFGAEIKVCLKRSIRVQMNPKWSQMFNNKCKPNKTLIIRTTDSWWDISTQCSSSWPWHTLASILSSTSGWIPGWVLRFKVQNKIAWSKDISYQEEIKETDRHHGFKNVSEFSFDLQIRAGFLELLGGLPFVRR